MKKNNSEALEKIILDEAVKETAEKLQNEKGENDNINYEELLHSLMSMGRKQRRKVFGKQATFSEQFKKNNKEKQLKELNK